jgi:hypothetical protein
MCFAKLGAFDGVVVAGLTGGRGGGASCHNGDCTRPGWVKKPGDSPELARGVKVGGGTAMFGPDVNGQANKDGD